MNPIYSRYYTYIKPIIRNKHIRNYSPIGFSLILSIIFFIFAIKPTVLTILSLQKSIEEQRQIVKQLQEKSKHIREGQKKLDEYGEVKLAHLRDYLPNKTELPALISILNSLSAYSSASISGLQFQPIEIVPIATFSGIPTKLREMDFTFNFNSNYPQAVAFIKNLSLVSRMISITSINISRKDANTSLQVVVNGKSYYIN